MMRLRIGWLIAAVLLIALLAPSCETTDDPAAPGRGEGDDDDDDDNGDDDFGDDDDDDALPPPVVELAITDPVSGVFLEGSSAIPVSGTITVEEGWEIERVRVAGGSNVVEATVDGDTFSAAGVTRNADDTFQEITARARVTDGEHRHSFADRSIVLNAPSNSLGGTLADAGIGRVNDPAIRRLETRVQGELNEMDLAALLAEQNPIYTHSDILVDVTVNTTSATFSQTNVGIDTVMQNTLLSAEVFDVEIGVEAIITWFAAGAEHVAATTGTVTADWIEATGNVLMDAYQGVPVVRVDDFALTYENLDFDIEDFPDFLEFAFENTVRDLMDTALAPVMEGILDDTITEFLSAFVLSRSADGASVTLPLDDLRTDYDGAILWLNGRVTVDQEDPEAPTVTGGLSTPSDLPELGTTVPGTDDEYGAALAIDDDFLNLAAAQITGTGGFQYAFEGQIGTGDDTVPLTAAALSNYMSGFDVYPQATPIRIEVRPTLPPVIRPESGANLLLVDLVNFRVEFIAELPGGDEPALTVALDALLRGTPSVASDGRSLTLAMEAAEQTVEMMGHRIAATDATGIEPLVEVLMPEIAGDMGGSFAFVPLPSFEGFDVRARRFEMIGDGGDYLAVYADLEPE